MHERGDQERERRQPLGLHRSAGTGSIMRMDIGNGKGARIVHLFANTNTQGEGGAWWRAFDIVRLPWTL